MLAMDVWCFSKSTIRVDLEKHQTRLHYWGNSLCNFEESPLQLWVFLLCTKQTGTVVHTFLHAHRTPQQGYKSCASMMKLADRFTPARLEAACAKALSYTPSPSLKNITTILQNGQDKVKNGTPPRTTGSYGLTRRAAREKGGVQA